MSDAAALDVHLHPLVLINISDHVVRFRLNAGSSRVLGALIGAQQGRQVDLFNSFELACLEGSGDAQLDVEYFQQRLAQYLEVFPNYEFLGWYSTGSTAQESDAPLHKKLQEISGNENPFLLLLDTTKLQNPQAAQSEELPIKVYDSVAHIAEGATSVGWKELPYIIDTLEAERIAVNHVAKSATTATTGHTSDFTQHAGGLGNSVMMLNNRVKDLLDYAKEVKAGTAVKNHAILRQMLSICQALEASHPEALHREFCGEFNDAALIVMLATLTKACAQTSDLLDKFQLAHDKKHRQRHHYPFG